MSAPQPIEFLNRYTGRVEREKVYGEAWLRWIYHSVPGRIALEVLVRRAVFSRWYGWRMDRPASRRKIAPFIREFGLDPAEFADPPESYRTFNEFFHRRLAPGVRPVDPDPAAVVFPADARHLGFPDVSRGDGIFVKGQRFDLPALLGDRGLAERYARGTLVLSRLCPVDYHRYHFPVAGTPGAPREIPGALYSVSPVALRQRISCLWENRRRITRLETDRLGTVLVLEIGATNVGSMVATFAPGRPVAKGDEMGYFRFGGSSTITVFEPGRIRLADDLVAQTSAGRELYAHVGDRMGTLAG